MTSGDMYVKVRAMKSKAYMYNKVSKTRKSHNIEELSSYRSVTL